MSRHHHHHHHYRGNRGPTTLHGGLFQLGLILMFFGIFMSLALGVIGVIFLVLGVLAIVGGYFAWKNRSPVAQNPVYPGYGAPPQQYGYQQPQYGAPQQPYYGQPTQPYYGDQGAPQYSPPPPPGQYPPPY